MTGNFILGKIPGNLEKIVNKIPGNLENIQFNKQSCVCMHTYSPPTQ